jgi:trigger factor
VPAYVERFPSIANPSESFPVNIQVNDLSETRKHLVIALEPAEVDAEHQAVVAEFVKMARLPGFRPGKAPAAMVAKRYAKEIGDEFRQKVVGKAYQSALKDQKIDVLNVVNVEPGTIEPGAAASVTVAVDVRPEIRLPEYTGLPTEIEPVEPTEKEIDEIVEGLRAERADFKVADRESRKGDFVKLAYEGNVEGKPILEIVPDKQIYGKVPQTWEEVEGSQEGVIPGLGKGIAGLKTGEKRDVSVAYPDPFPGAPALAGKAATYAVEVLEVRERVLPPIDADFFKAHQVDDLAGLRSQIAIRLKFQKEQRNLQAQRRQVTDALGSKIEIIPPDSLVEAESQSILRRFIEENMRRGVSPEQFEKDKKELVDGARKSAVNRVKIQLALAKIAENEKLTVSGEDLERFIQREAMRTNEKPARIAKELTKNREQLQSVQQSLLFDKAVDFLVSKATVRTVTPKAEQPAQS